MFTADVCTIVFQSTLPRGSDLAYSFFAFNLRSFQSTLPRGSDFLSLFDLIIAHLFQSTLPRGSDQAAAAVVLLHGISIHAPSRERHVLFSIRRLLLHFNPRSLAGATVRQVFDRMLACRISIHAPSRERRHIQLYPWTCRHFNPRSLAGATCRFHVIYCFAPYFNPRSLAGATATTGSRPVVGLFQSTLPRGSDMQTGYQLGNQLSISIHAPSRERPSRFKISSVT